MIKYELIPGQLLHEGTITQQQLHAPKPCSNEVLELTHHRDYLHKLDHQTLSEREQKHIGFPQSPALTLREKIITQGTIDCCRFAQQSGVSLNIAGGTHHAFADRGEGFCLLNDFAVAANFLLHNNFARQIIIIDLDVHQGNGTARVFESDSRVFTFSMHGAHNYPFRKEKSDLDVPLADGTDDSTYLGLLHEHLYALIDSVKPDFAFYLSGVDVLATDKFGKLKLSIDGCRKRDREVFTALHSRNIPCVVAMGGGYSADVNIVVEAHCNTFREAVTIY